MHALTAHPATVSLLLFLAVSTAQAVANDFTDPNTHNPGITPGTVLSFNGDDGQSITLTAVQGDRESLYPNASTTLAVTPGDTYQGQALVAYTYSSTAHSEDYEGPGVDSQTAAGYGTIYKIPTYVVRGESPPAWVTNSGGSHPMTTFTGYYQYELQTNLRGPATISSFIEGPLPAGAVLNALLNGASGTPNYSAPMDFIGSVYPGQATAGGSWVERAQIITNEIDASVQAGTYHYKRYVPTWQYGGTNGVYTHLYGIYVPVEQKLYFAGDPRAVLTDPDGNVVTPNNANGFYEIDHVEASILGVSGTWPYGNKTGEAAQPGFYMSATSPQLAPAVPPTGTIASPPVVRQNAQVAVSFSISS